MKRLRMHFLSHLRDKFARGNSLTMSPSLSSLSRTIKSISSPSSSLPCPNSYLCILLNSCISFFSFLPLFFFLFYPAFSKFFTTVNVAVTRCHPTLSRGFPNLLGRISICWDQSLLRTWTCEPALARSFPNLILQRRRRVAVRAFCPP